MRRITISVLLSKGGDITACLSCLLMFMVASQAQGAGPYDISWYTIDGSGGTSIGGPYTLTGTIGQADADFSSGGDYELLGGFWLGSPLCIVGFDDFARFAEQWLEIGTGLAGDLDGDNDVDFDDLNRFADYWLRWCPPNWSLK